ncbi:hypothetical protein SLEP1_g38598 [Rubroshorea leprosula]|uniref:Uncharacterized protein n=1 Tax=Rubroshorea leprosula TaxID=152421 RepID=A0AAV5KXL5_9ROSI|nr:hypothetical protein SLEP1_g38598 [Rubroshorea leprosula]
MLGVFQLNGCSRMPDALVAADAGRVGCSRMPDSISKITSTALLNRFLERSKMEGEIGDEGNGDSIIVTATINDLQI